MRTILIIGGSSDIGLYLIDRYLTENCRVIATYRNPKHFEVKSNPNIDNLTRLPLNIGNYIQRFNLYDYLLKKEIYWDTAIFLNATMNPIGPFMEIDANQWEKSIEDNALIPCTFLQRLYKVRNSSDISNICYFSGGNVNGTFDNFSAYSISKMILHKFVELINSEYEDLNPFILGPGFISTKIHKEIEKSNLDLKKSRDLIERGLGTPLEDVFDAIEWCCQKGKDVIGGRNLAVRHDPWKGEDGEKFAKRLKRNKELLKMRRKVK